MSYAYPVAHHDGHQAYEFPASPPVSLTNIPANSQRYSRDSAGETRQRSIDDSALNSSSDIRINIDYLGCDWREEHIWSCWKFIGSRREQTRHHSRLKNTIWRAWAQCRNNIPTVSPRRINWLRENDVRYLYGPSWSSAEQGSSEQTRPIAPGSDTKPLQRSILKERNRLDVLIQATRSSLSLALPPTIPAPAPAQTQTRWEYYWKLHGVLPDVPTIAIPVQGIRNAPLQKYLLQNITRAIADLDVYFFSQSQTSQDRTRSSRIGEPHSSTGKKHIQFCNEVEQRISIPSHRDESQKAKTNTNTTKHDRDTYSGVVSRLIRVLQSGVLKRTDERSTPNFLTGREMIAFSPPTTLKA